MHVLTVEFDLHLPQCQSLKDKRSTIRPVIDGARRRFEVAVAETDHADMWQRSAIGVAAVSGTASKAEQVIDAVERFVWSFPELEVLEAHRRWLEVD